MSNKKQREQREARRTDRQVDKAVKRHGPGVEALAEAVYGKSKRRGSSGHRKG